MKGFQEKCEKPPFLGILGQNGQFWKFLAKMGKNGIFFKKAFGTLFSLLKALINCKVSEKSNERFSSNSVTDGRTDARTYVRTWILRSPTTSSRDQKSSRNPNFQLFETQNNLFWPFLVSRRSRWRPKDSRPSVRTSVRASVRHAVARKPFITFFWNCAVS